MRSRAGQCGGLSSTGKNRSAVDAALYYPLQAACFRVPGHLRYFGPVCTLELPLYYFTHAFYFARLREQPCRRQPIPLISTLAGHQAGSHHHGGWRSIFVSVLVKLLLACLGAEVEGMVFIFLGRCCAVLAYRHAAHGVSRHLITMHTRQCRLKKEFRYIDVSGYVDIYDIVSGRRSNEKNVQSVLAV